MVFILNNGILEVLKAWSYFLYIFLRFYCNNVFIAIVVNLLFKLKKFVIILQQLMT